MVAVFFFPMRFFRFFLSRWLIPCLTAATRFLRTGSPDSISRTSGQWMTKQENGYTIKLQRDGHSMGSSFFTAVKVGSLRHSIDYPDFDLKTHALHSNPNGTPPACK